jgi:23S rRNA (adenine2503-C2)-methyltransferase
MPITLLGLNTEELRELITREGQPAYRGTQLAEWLYKHGVHNFDDMLNLSPNLRIHLQQSYEPGSCNIVSRQISRDGTIKLLLEMIDGARVETVGMPYKDRFSCCVSTQVGCPIGCVFCATGLSGFLRNLTAGEIVSQVLAIREAVQKYSPQKQASPVSHVTFMGMGEPLLNFEATLKALSLLNKEMGISARHLSISTIGIVPEIKRLADEKLQATLAVSLHAPNDELRHRLIPKAGKWHIVDIIDTCREYVAKTGRRVTFEYCLLGGINDSPSEANELAKLVKGLNCHINLILFNRVSGLPFQASKNAANFARILQESNIQVTQRLERGADIDAACGQLRRRLAIS